MIDQAVEEIRARRRLLLKKQYGGSVDRFVEEAIEWQKKHPEKVVALRDKKPEEALV